MALAYISMVSSTGTNELMSRKNTPRLAKNHVAPRHRKTTGTRITGTYNVVRGTDPWAIATPISSGIRLIRR